MSQCIHLVKTSAAALLLLVVSCAFWACGKNTPVSTWQPGDTVTLRLDEHALEVELALTPASQAKGLMKRESMESDHGMLFVFDKVESRSFWMKNTWIPLDIAYIDAQGVIREIHPMFPNNLNSVKSVSSDIQFALETNRNWFKEHAIQPGVKIDLSQAVPIMRDHGIPSKIQ